MGSWHVFNKLWKITYRSKTSEAVIFASINQEHARCMNNQACCMKTQLGMCMNVIYKTFTNSFDSYYNSICFDFVNSILHFLWPVFDAGNLAQEQ